jgi:hypothetical protein
MTVKEAQIEQRLIDKLTDLKYTFEVINQLPINTDNSRRYNFQLDPAVVDD